MHVVCKAHKKRVMFFLLLRDGLVVLHRHDGEKCSLPLMAEGHEIPQSVIDRAIFRDKYLVPR